MKIETTVKAGNRKVLLYSDLTKIMQGRWSLKVANHTYLRKLRCETAGGAVRYSYMLDYNGAWIVEWVSPSKILICASTCSRPVAYRITKFSLVAAKFRSDSPQNMWLTYGAKGGPATIVYKCAEVLVLQYEVAPWGEVVAWRA